MQYPFLKIVFYPSLKTLFAVVPHHQRHVAPSAPLHPFMDVVKVEVENLASDLLVDCRLLPHEMY